MTILLVTIASFHLLLPPAAAVPILLSHKERIEDRYGPDVGAILRRRSVMAWILVGNALAIVIDSLLIAGIHGVAPGDLNHPRSIVAGGTALGLFLACLLPTTAVAVLAWLQLGVFRNDRDRVQQAVATRISNRDVTVGTRATLALMSDAFAANDRNAWQLGLDQLRTLAGRARVNPGKQSDASEEMLGEVRRLANATMPGATRFWLVEIPALLATRTTATLGHAGSASRVRLAQGVTDALLFLLVAAAEPTPSFGEDTEFTSVALGTLATNVTNLAADNDAAAGMLVDRAHARLRPTWVGEGGRAHAQRRIALQFAKVIALESIALEAQRTTAAAVATLTDIAASAADQNEEALLGVYLGSLTELGAALEPSAADLADSALSTIQSNLERALRWPCIAQSSRLTEESNRVAMALHANGTRG